MDIKKLTAKKKVSNLLKIKKFQLVSLLVSSLKDQK